MGSSVITLLAMLASAAVAIGIYLLLQMVFGLAKKHPKPFYIGLSIVCFIGIKAVLPESNQTTTGSSTTYSYRGESRLQSRSDHNEGCRVIDQALAARGAASSYRADFNRRCLE